MKPLQERINEALKESRMVDHIEWGSNEYGMDVIMYIHNENDTPIKFDEKEINKIIKNGDAPHADRRTIEQIFKALPDAQFIYFSYYDAYGDEDEHEYGYWDKDEMDKGMQD